MWFWLRTPVSRLGSATPDVGPWAALDSAFVSESVKSRRFLLFPHSLAP